MRHGSTSSISKYTEVARKIESFSEFTHFILMKVTLTAIILPNIIATYFKYYVLRLGDESFQEFPFMYVNSSFFSSFKYVEIGLYI